MASGFMEPPCTSYAAQADRSARRTTVRATQAPQHRASRR